MPVQCSTTELPSSFFVNYKGELQDNESVLLLQFSNGSYLTSRILNLIFLMNQTSGNQYIVSIDLDFGSFSNQTITNATISNGRLIIDSTSSIFVISPDLLKDGESIQLYKIGNQTLFGNVERTGKPPTAIGDYRVTSKMVVAHPEPNSEHMALPLTLGFDPKSGVLTEAAGQLRDILLKMMGIDFILGGTFELISYSDNLNFNLVLNSQFTGWQILSILAIVFAMFFAITVAYKASNKRKKPDRKKVKNAKNYLKSTKTEGGYY